MITRADAILANGAKKSSINVHLNARGLPSSRACNEASGTSLRDSNASLAVARLNRNREKSRVSRSLIIPGLTIFESCDLTSVARLSKTRVENPQSRVPEPRGCGNGAAELPRSRTGCCFDGFRTASPGSIHLEESSRRQCLGTPFGDTRRSTRARTIIIHVIETRRHGARVPANRPRRRGHLVVMRRVPRWSLLVPLYHFTDPEREFS